MKKIGIIIVAMLTSICEASYVVLEGHEANFYLELNTISFDNNLTKIWILADYKKRNQFGDFSHRKLTQFNCKTQQIRILQSVYYSGSKGDGKVTGTSNEISSWEFISPRSIINGAYEEVCKK